MIIKKLLSFIYKVLLYTVISLIGYVVVKVLIAQFTHTTPSLFNHYIYIVQTNSMEPTINVGDIVIVRICNISEIAINDVISFKCIDPTEVIYGETIIHRVIDITSENGFVECVTKGDNSLLVDSYKVSYFNFVGKVVANSAIVGKVFTFFTSSYLIVFIVVLSILLNIIVNLIKKIIKIKKEEAEKEKVKQEILNEMKGNKND